MTIRVDSSWISGAIVVGDSGFGVLASEVPTIGENGGGYLVNDIAEYSVPPNAEVAGRILSFPSSGVFKANEDSSFEHTGASQGIYTIPYQFYVDGVATGSPATITTEFVDDRNTTIAGSLPKLTSEMSLDMDVSSFNITITGNLPKLNSSMILNNQVPVYNLVIGGSLPKLSSAMTIGNVQVYNTTINSPLPKLSSAVVLTSDFNTTSNIVINGTIPKLTSSMSITRNVPSYDTTITSSLPKLSSVMAINSEGLYYFIPEGNMVFIKLASNYINIP